MGFFLPPLLRGSHLDFCFQIDVWWENEDVVFLMVMEEKQNKRSSLEVRLGLMGYCDLRTYRFLWILSPCDGLCCERIRKNMGFVASTVRPAAMKAVVIATSDHPQVLQVQEVENPEIGDDEVLIRVDAAAINRADALQRKGLHLLKSGMAVPAGQVLLVPSGVSLKDAAGIPEVACPVWSTVLMMSRLSAGETFLVHGGSIGIGTFAIQKAKYQGARVFVTSADVCINYKTVDFVAWVKEEPGGKGVNVILDNIAGAFIIGFQGGTVAEVNLSGLLARCLTVQAAGLRNRSLENKAVIVSEAEKNVWPAITGAYKYFPLTEAAEAHQLMESSSKHVGKIPCIQLCYGYASEG
ncbi:hypothetical protein AAG906_013218 [Vitis piasezkii]